MRAFLTTLAVVISITAGSLGASGLEIRGRLLDAEGMAVAGATVKLVSLPDRAGTGRLQLAGRFSPAPSAAELSREDGTFAITAPAPGMWRLLVGSGAHLPADLLLRPLVDSKDVGDVVLMDGEAQDLVVVDSEGRGVGGLRLHVRERLVERRSQTPFFWRIAERTIETSDAGRATLLRADGSEAWVAAVTGERFVYGRVGPGPATVSLTLEPLRRVRVVNAEGHPVADAVGSFYQPSLAFGRTDAGGGILVPHQDIDRPVLYFATAEGAVAGQVEGGAGTELVVRLGPMVAMDGRVIDSVSGHGIDGAFVWAWHTYRKSGRDGRFRLRLGVTDLLRISATGYAPTAVRPEQLADDGLTVDLFPVVFREGRVVDVDGEGLVGAEVRAEANRVDLAALVPGPDWHRRFLSPVVHSGTEGRFRLPWLAPSVAYELLVSRSGYASSRVIAPPIEPGQTVDDLQIVLRPASRVLGRVLDADRQPVVDATVGIVPQGTPRRIRSRFARADGEGRFELLDLGAGIYQLAAEAPGLAYRVIAGIEILDDGSDVDLGSIVLSPAARLEGRVVDREGAAVAAARVQAALRRWPRLDRDSTRRETETDAEGRFRLVELSPSDVLSLDVTKEGYRKLEIPRLQVEGGDPLELVLLPGIVLRGRVIDAAHRPVGEATVTLNRWSDDRGRSSESVDAGAGGIFVFESQAPGRFELLGRSKDGLAGSLEGELKAGDEELVLVLSSAAALSGRLSDPGGLGVAFGRITLEPYEEGQVDARGPRTKRIDARSAADGTFEIAGVEPGTYRLIARHLEFAPLTEILELSAGVSGPLELRFPDRLRKIRGRVVDENGEGVADAEVHYYEGEVFAGGLNPGDAVTSAGGNFELRILRPGLHTLWVSHPAFARKVVKLEIADDAEPVIVELDRGVVLTGRLLGLERQQAHRVRIGARSRKGLMTMTGTVDSDGRYRILGLRPGEWTVSASLPQSTRLVRESLSVSGFDGELVLDLEFPAGHRLSGLVLFDGRALSAAGVALECLHAGELAEQTGPDGTFSFEGVPAGDCWVEVSEGMSQVSARRPVEVSGDQELVIEIRSAVLAGTVVRASDLEPVADANVELVDPHRNQVRRIAATDALGGFSFPVADGEAVTLRVTAESYTVAEERIEMAAGTGDLQITLRPAVPVVLRTLTDDGEVPHQVSVGARQLTPSSRVHVQQRFHPDREGRIVIDNLGVGRWDLYLRDEHGRWARLELEVPGAEVHEVVLVFQEQR